MDIKFIAFRAATNEWYPHVHFTLDGVDCRCYTIDHPNDAECCIVFATENNVTYTNVPLSSPLLDGDNIPTKACVVMLVKEHMIKNL